MKHACNITTLLFLLTIVVQPGMASEGLDFSIARGGKLYDKWFKVNTSNAPNMANPAYPESGKYKGKKASDWRCKECHGWDYLGKDGAYSSGKHFTGIGGIFQASTMNRTKLASVLRDNNHGYAGNMLSDRDVMDISNFLQEGMVDMDRYIDRSSKKISGDAVKGKSYYQTICTGSHGLDGKAEDEAPPLGKLSNKNPWESLHKILNGQPDAEMPALLALDMQVSVDILAYLQTLPQE